MSFTLTATGVIMISTLGIRKLRESLRKLLRDHRQEAADLGLKLMAESRVQAFSKLRTLCCLYPRGISGDSKRLLTQGSKAEDSNNSECLVFLVGLNEVLEDSSQTDSPTERGSFKKN